MVRVYYEVMVIGLFIIIINRGGNLEVIIFGKNGIVIMDYENFGVFVDCIDYLLFRLNKREEMGRRGCELVELYYGWLRVVWDILSVINDLGLMFFLEKLG